MINNILYDDLLSTWLIDERYAKLITAGLNQDKSQNTFSTFGTDEVGYEARGSTAVISIDGVLNKKGYEGLCVNLIGYDQIINAIDLAEADDNILNIVFRVDTRGGSFEGLNELRERIFTSPKNTFTYFENKGFSAGMYGFTSSDKIYTNKTTKIGSIGVIASVRLPDPQSQEKIIVFTSKNAQNKVCDIMTEDCQLRIQNDINIAENMFYKVLLEKYTTKTQEDIKRDFNNGDTIYSEEALKLGYIDGIMSFKEFLATMPSSQEKIAKTTKEANMSEELDSSVDNSLKYQQLEKKLLASEELVKKLEAEKTEIKEELENRLDISKKVIAQSLELSCSKDATLLALEEANEDKARLILFESISGGGSSISPKNTKPVNEEDKKLEEAIKALEEVK